MISIKSPSQLSGKQLLVICEQASGTEEFQLHVIALKISKKNGAKDAKKYPTDFTAVESIGTLALQREKMHFGFKDKDEVSEIYSESDKVHFLGDLQHYYEGTWNKGFASLFSS